MKYDMVNVLIADDEKIVREGLRYIIDWKSLGFCICDEAGTGPEALEMIERYKPGLVLLDIKMPGMNGTDLIEKARHDGFNGFFIIISGYSDFQYAQTALKFGASCYLTKPVDEDELTKAVKSVHEKIEYESNSQTLKDQYLGKAKISVLHDLLTGSGQNPDIDYRELGLCAPIYQVVIYEKYTPYYSSYNFADLLMITNEDNNSFEQSTVGNNNIVLLKGSFALRRFGECLSHYREGTQKGSPLDTVFIAYGEPVSSLADIHRSYETASRLIKQRFFCAENQHFLSYDDLHAKDAPCQRPDPETAQCFGSRLSDCIKTGNGSKIHSVLDELSEYLRGIDCEVTEIKYCLADIFLQVKQSIMKTYPEKEIPLVHNSAVLELVENKQYLYEIIQYFTEQFDMMIRSVNSESGESILENVTDYIDHNYAMPLKLEQLAELFGYSSSYLGKQFSAKVGMNFNTYLDKVRIDNAVALLDNTDMKIYEVSARVGYKNVDYFHQKFKKFMNTSPAEYRKKG